jgi:hypothetical protein
MNGFHVVFQILLRFCQESLFCLLKTTALPWFAAAAVSPAVILLESSLPLLFLPGTVGLGVGFGDG